MIAGAGLAAGLIGLAAYITQLDDSQSMCKTVSIFPNFDNEGHSGEIWFFEVRNHIVISISFQVKELGDTKLTVTSTTTLADLVLTEADAKSTANLAIQKTFSESIRAQLNVLENKINGYTTPDCSS